MDEKAMVLIQWIEGCQKVVVATSVFGIGVDYSQVTMVLHVGAPTNVIDFV